MSTAKIWYANDEGKWVQMINGNLMVGDTEVPVVDGEFQLPETRFTQRIAAAERELIKRYDQGEFG